MLHGSRDEYQMNHLRQLKATRFHLHYSFLLMHEQNQDPKLQGIQQAVESNNQLLTLRMMPLQE